jgi:hypothetical protein
MYNKRQIINLRFIDLPLSFFSSLIWVSYYGYNYNVSFLNFAHVNWYSLFLWTGGLFATIRIYRFLAERIAIQPVPIFLTWFFYFVGLWAVEFVGYYMLRIRLVTDEGSLFLGVIHGPPILKAYYMSVGPAIVLLIAAINKLSGHYNKTENRTAYISGEGG